MKNFKNNILYNKMDKSYFIEVKNKLNNEELKKNIKEIQEKIIKCLDEERKTNEELDIKLYEVELLKFRNVIKDIFLEFEIRSELRDLIWLYFSLMDINKRMKNVNLGISFLEVMRE